MRRAGVERAQDPLGTAARPQHPDVRHRRLEQRPRVGHIGREVMRHHDGIARGVEGQPPGEIRRVARHEPRGRGEALGREPGGATVHDDHAEPDVCRAARQRLCVVAGATQHQLGNQNSYVPDCHVVEPHPYLSFAAATAGVRSGNVLPSRAAVLLAHVGQDSGIVHSVAGKPKMMDRNAVDTSNDASEIRIVLVHFRRQHHHRVVKVELGPG